MGLGAQYEHRVKNQRPPLGTCEPNLLLSNLISTQNSCGFVVFHVSRPIAESKHEIERAKYRSHQSPVPNAFVIFPRRYVVSVLIRQEGNSTTHSSYRKEAIY